MLEAAVQVHQAECDGADRPRLLAVTMTAGQNNDEGSWDRRPPPKPVL